MKKGNRSANLMPHYKDGGAVEKKVMAKPTASGRAQQWTRAGVTGDDIEARAKNADTETRRAAARAAGSADASRTIANNAGRVPRSNKKLLAESHMADGKPPLIVTRRGKPRGGK